MFDNKKILPPPWMALPDIERSSIHWRMGIGEAYLEKWAPWYRQLGEAEKKEYLRLFPEPLPWLGCITHAAECEFVHKGDLYVTLWRKNGTPKYNRRNIISTFTADKSPEFFMFWGHQPSKDGKIGKSCFSQWWKSYFFYHGEQFCCMEQCMMLGKARLFKDAAAAEQIKASTDPKEIKALGRTVQGFDGKLWDSVKYSLVLTGNYNKFVQNPDLRNFLLSTGDSILVEASPYDRIWGIGLSEDDPRAKDPRQWEGENLLGFALMEVRDEIRRTYANENLCCDPWEAGL